jgi:hypothetical protein
VYPPVISSAFHSAQHPTPGHAHVRGRFSGHAVSVSVSWVRGMVGLDSLACKSCAHTVRVFAMQFEELVASASDRPTAAHLLNLSDAGKWDVGPPKGDSVRDGRSGECDLGTVRRD